MGQPRLMAWWIALAAFIAASPAFAQTTANPPATSSTQPPAPAAVVQLHGVIDEYSTDALIKRINRVKAQGAKTIIIELNTPGGLVAPTLEVTRFLRQQNDVHTVAFVEEMALSAGIIIGLACDELVMAPESKIGDAAPITLSSEGGLQTLGETERAKAESPIIADVRASAERNGYDPLLATSMVSLKRVVHYIESPDGRRKFVDAGDYAKLTKDGWQAVAGVRDPIDSGDELLTLQSNTAEKIGLSKGTFASPQAFASARNLTIIATLGPNTGEKFVGWLGSPWLRGILIVVLFQSLYFAFGHPGHGWPEAIALVVLSLLLGVPLLTGFASWLEVLAILLGLVLLAIEVFVIPGFGFAGFAGIALVLGGLVLTFVGAEPSLPGVLPSLKGTWINLQRGLIIVTAGLACSLALWIWLNRYLPKLPYFNRLILTSIAGDIETKNLERPIESGPAIGDIGIAVTELKPGGSVKFKTESYPDGRVAAVVSESGFLPAGTPVVVHDVGGNRVVVRAQHT